MSRFQDTKMAVIACLMRKMLGFALVLSELMETPWVADKQLRPAGNPKVGAGLLLWEEEEEGGEGG